MSFPKGATVGELADAMQGRTKSVVAWSEEMTEEYLAKLSATCMNNGKVEALVNKDHLGYWSLRDL